MTWYPPRPIALSWMALLALLGTTVFLSYQPLGDLNLIIALLIATSKALIVAAVFMELRKRSGVMIAFAAAGFFWLGILIWLSGIDFATRLNFLLISRKLTTPASAMPSRRLRRDGAGQQPCTAYDTCPGRDRRSLFVSRAPRCPTGVCPSPV